jgi:hypothetical protein
MSEFNLFSQVRGRRGIGWPNELVVLWVEEHFKTSHPFDSNDYVLMSKVEDNKRTV